MRFYRYEVEILNEAYGETYYESGIIVADNSKEALDIFNEHYAGEVVMLLSMRYVGDTNAPLIY